MRAKRAGWLPLMLCLAGCATTCPSPQTQLPPQKPTKPQEPAPKTEQKQDPQQLKSLTLPRMLNALQRVAAADTNEAERLSKQLQNGSTELFAGDRFELALLLSQKGASSKSLKQALRLLDELKSEAGEPGVKEVLQLQQRVLALEQRYRRERKKSIELQNKIEYLKGLERELDESNRQITEPAEAKPEHLR
ncbi:MAG: hypothetical protein P8166_02325 [Candidatus Thiodiazotropha sp.]